jgi:hypothetical protein
VEVLRDPNVNVGTKNAWAFQTQYYVDHASQQEQFVDEANKK